MTRIFNKLLLFLSLMILCFSVHTASASVPSIDDPAILPSVSGTGELLSNAGFESYFNWDWNQYTGSAYSTELSYTGSRSVKMCVTEGDSTYISQGRTGLRKGAVYQISARVYTANADVGFAISNEYYGVNSSWIGQEVWRRKLTSGSWTQISTTFQIPEDTQSTFVYFWLYGSGNVAYIDDASLVMVKEPVRVNVTTDQIYYYTNEDVTHGSVRLKVNTDSYSDYSGWKAELNICDSKGNKLYTRDGISLSAVEKYVDFPLSYLSDPNEEYTVSVIISSSDGIILEQHSDRAYRKFPRPSMIDSTGNFYVDGELFVPVIGYWVYNQSDFYTQAKAMGINVIETTWNMMHDPEGVIAELNRLQANGFMGIVSLYYEEETGWNEKYREDTKNLISRIKDHPAVFAYCLMDEPIAKNIDLEELSEAYEYIRSVDAVHPVYACDMQSNYAEGLSKYHDVVCFDCYPGSPSASLDYVSRHYSEADFHIRNQKKPKLSILQFYETQSYFPTADEMRNMIYQNYMQGAKGHGFYSIGWTNVTDSVSGQSIRNLDTATATAVKEWNTEESEVFKNTFVDENYRLICKASHSNFEWYMFEDNSELYLAIRNKTTSRLNASLNNAVFSSDMELINDFGSGNAISIMDGRAELTLDEKGTYLYRISAENAKILLKDYDDVTYSYKIYKYNGDLYIEAVNKVTYASKAITIEDSLIKGNMYIENISGYGAAISELRDGLIKLRVPESSRATYVLFPNDVDILQSCDETTYSYRIYRYRGDIYIEATNNITYTSTTVTINIPAIKGDMLIEHISGDGASVTEFGDGFIKIKVPKSTKAEFALVTDRGAKPVPYFDGKVVTSLVGGEKINAKVFERAQTILALYEGDRLIQVVKGDEGEEITITLPDTVKPENYVKLMRWNGLVPVAESVRIPK